MERFFSFQIDRNSFDYYRFCCHVRYLARRIAENRQAADGDATLFAHLCEEYPEADACAKEMIRFLPDPGKLKVNGQEYEYLVIYIIRLYHNQTISK